MSNESKPTESKTKVEQIEIKVDNDGNIIIVGWCRTIRELNPDSCNHDCKNCYCG